MGDSPDKQTPCREQLELEDLFRRARAGDAGAAQRLFDHWGPHFLRVIRQRLRLTPRLRGLFDSDDFLQESRLALFTNGLADTALRSPEEFVAYLTTVVRNKVRLAGRAFLQEECRTLSREVALDPLKRGAGGQLPDCESTPGAEALIDEEFEALMRGRPFHHRLLFLRLRQGRSYAEAASDMGLGERAVRRLAARIQASLKLNRDPARRPGDSADHE